VARGPIAPDHTIEFRLLGPLEALADGERLPLGPPQQRSLLILLLLHANEVVSRDRLIEELWSGEPPATAPKLVQLYVSALRKALEPGRAPGAPHRVVRTRPPGYVLEVEAEAVDLARFERLRADAAGALARDDAAGARARLNEALALWRGEPLADVAYEPYAQAEIARLAELRQATLEDRIDVDLSFGEHAALVGELEALVGQHPLRERLRAAHMLALYRSGRQAEALSAYQDARRALVDELGIEPGRRLRDLEQAVLRQDPELEPPALAEPAPGRSQSAFVGRERELAELSGALDDALAGRGQVVLVAGEPGIGKSRLADELMRRAESRAALTLAGRCWEAGGAPPYWPWVQSLRAYIRNAEPGQVRAQLGTGAAELAPDPSGDSGARAFASGGRARFGGRPVPLVRGGSRIPPSRRAGPAAGARPRRPPRGR
jgi:DNA-binding SARP family transcriptional activator